MGPQQWTQMPICFTQHLLSPESLLLQVLQTFHPPCCWTTDEGRRWQSPTATPFTPPLWQAQASPAEAERKPGCRVRPKR